MAQKQPSEQEKLKGYFYAESGKDRKYRDEVTEFINSLKVPATKEGKPDIKAYADSLVSGAQKIVDRHFGDGRDPDWAPKLPDIFTILDSYDNVVEGDRLRTAVKNEIVNAYNTTSSNRVLTRSAGRALAGPFEVGKAFVGEVASETAPGLEGIVKGASSPESLQRRAPIVLSKYVREQQEVYDRTGRDYQIKKAA